MYRLRVGGVEDVDSHGGVAQHTEGRVQKLILGKLVDFSIKWVDEVPLVHKGKWSFVNSGWVGGVRVPFSPLIAH